MSLTRTEAAAIWSEIFPELDQRARDARPKLKSFEAHHLFEQARKHVLENLVPGATRETLKDAARYPFLKFRYRHGSPFVDNS